ncbi:helix-turn-helix domain-containing protein [Thiorhodococcus minor]
MRIYTRSPWAAELLGLSRQSLYVKLSRYGLETDPPKNSNLND